MGQLFELEQSLGLCPDPTKGLALWRGSKEAKPPGGFQGGALSLAQVHAIARRRAALKLLTLVALYRLIVAGVG
jgi:hypothetical protein